MPEVASLPIYCEVHVCADAFAQTTRVRGSTQSVQDRQGLHTFARGDLVEYMQAEEGEEPPQACIYGVISVEPTPEDPQQRKILVLYDVEASTFFLGTWPAWRRMRKPNVDFQNFNCENSEHIRLVDVSILKTMESSFALSPLATGLATRRQAVAQAAKAPPRLALQVP